MIKQKNYLKKNKFVWNYQTIFNYFNSQLDSGKEHYGIPIEQKIKFSQIEYSITT